MIKIIKLREDEVMFLKEICNIDILAKFASKTNFEKKSNSWILLLEVEDMEFINDELLKSLTDSGLTNDEVNSLGNKIDSFLDKFNHYE